MSGGNVGVPPNAEQCVCMLERGPLQQLWPLEVLRIGDFVTAQLAQMGALQERSMLAQAAELERQMVECFPRWTAALDLLGALAARSERLRAEWLPSAVPRLVKLVRLGVDPGLKARALCALGAFVSGKSAAAAAEAATIVWDHLLVHSDVCAPPLPPMGSATELSGHPSGAAIVLNAARTAGLGSGDHRGDLDGRAMYVGFGGLGADDANASACIVDAASSQPLVSPHLPAAHKQLLVGLQEDFGVEGRHQKYPQTQAFLQLLGRIVRSSAASGLPVPGTVGDFVAWAAEHLFAHFDSFGYRVEEDKWSFAASCLSLLLEVLRGYDPAHCEAQEGADVEQPPNISPIELSRWLLVDGRPPVPRNNTASLNGTQFVAAEQPPLDFPSKDFRARGISDFANAHSDACRGPVDGGALTNASGVSEHRLPEFPTGLKLLCAFSLPRSPLLHRLLWVLAQTSARLAPSAHNALHSERGLPACAVQLYRTASLGVQLLQHLLMREPALHAKLARVRAAQQHVTGWACWRPEQLEALHLLHAELWRSLPTSTMMALPHALIERFFLGEPGASADVALTAEARAGRRSTLAAIWLLLHAAVWDKPRVCGQPLVLSALSVLRQARAQLGAGFASLLRAEEGVLFAARRALVLLLEAHDVREAAEGDGADRDSTNFDPWDAEALELAIGSPSLIELALAETTGALAYDESAQLLEPDEARSLPACQLLLLLLDELQRTAPVPACHDVVAPTAAMLLELEAEPRFAEVGMVPETSVILVLFELCAQTVEVSAGAAMNTMVARPLAMIAEVVMELLFRLGSHLRCGGAVLLAAQTSGLLPSWLNALPRLLSQLEMYSVQCGCVELAAAPSSQPVLCAWLHAIGHGLKLAAASLAASIRSPPARVNLDSGAAAASSIRAEPLLKALLLVSGMPAGSISCDEAAAEPLLCAVLRMLLAVARLALGDGADGSPIWNVDEEFQATQWRGEGPLRLYDVRALSVQLDATGAGDADRQAILLSAVQRNERRHMLHGLLHALSAVRQLTLLLPLACSSSDLQRPRLSTLLLPLSHLAVLPLPLAPLAPPLCACVRGLLCGLGSRALVPATEQLHVLQLTLQALTQPPLSATCRIELYMLLLAVLHLAMPPSTLCWQHSQQFELARQAAAALRASASKDFSTASGNAAGDGVTLMQLLALDARDGTTRQQGVALAVLHTMLLFESNEVMVELTNDAEELPWLALLCRGTLLSRLLEPLYQPTDATKHPLCQLLTEPLDAAVAHRVRHDWVLWHYQVALALVLLVLLRLCGNPNAALAVALHDSGSLNMLVAAPYLSLPLSLHDNGSFCGSSGLGSGVGSISMRSALMLRAKLMLPVLRVMNAAALATRQAPQQTGPLLAHFLAGSPIRLRTMRQLLMAAAQLPPRASLPLPLLQMSHGLASLVNAGWESLAQLERASVTTILPSSGTRRAFLESALQLLPPLAERLLATRARFGADSGTRLGAFVSLLGGAGGCAISATPGPRRLALNANDLTFVTASGAITYDEASAAEVGELLSELLGLCCRCCELTGITNNLGDMSLRGGRPLRAELMRLSPLFSPHLSLDAGIIAGASPPLGVLAQLVCWSGMQLRESDLQHTRLRDTAENLAANTSEHLRQLCAHIADVLPAAQALIAREKYNLVASLRAKMFTRVLDNTTLACTIWTCTISPPLLPPPHTHTRDTSRPCRSHTRIA